MAELSVQTAKRASAAQLQLMRAIKDVEFCISSTPTSHDRDLLTKINICLHEANDRLTLLVAER